MKVLLEIMWEQYGKGQKSQILEIDLVTTPYFSTSGET